jgi:hypothetical protein
MNEASRFSREARISFSWRLASPDCVLRIRKQ